MRSILRGDFDLGQALQVQPISVGERSIFWNGTDHAFTHRHTSYLKGFWSVSVVNPGSSGNFRSEHRASAGPLTGCASAPRVRPVTRPGHWRVPPSASTRRPVS